MSVSFNDLILLSDQIHSIILVVGFFSLVPLMVDFFQRGDFIFNKFLNGSWIENLITIAPVPFLISIRMPSLSYSYLNEINQTPRFQIIIIRHQWYWHYELESVFIISQYMNRSLPRNFGADCLILPFNTIIFRIFTSEDVIHSWSLPSLFIKMDCVPRRLNSLYFDSFLPRRFYGSCIEICGIRHSIIPIIVDFKSF